jgi:hypothetical protein
LRRALVTSRAIHRRSVAQLLAARQFAADTCSQELNSP